MENINVHLKSARKLRKEDLKKVIGGAMRCPSGYYPTYINGQPACCPRNRGNCIV